MICKYETRIVAKCPANGQPDVYDVVFQSDAMIECERIVDLVRQFDGTEVYQETITANLAQALHCKVTTAGYHSGIKTTVEAP